MAFFYSALGNKSLKHSWTLFNCDDYRYLLQGFVHCAAQCNRLLIVLPCKSQELPPAGIIANVSWLVDWNLANSSSCRSQTFKLFVSTKQRGYLKSVPFCQYDCKGTKTSSRSWGLLLKTNWKLSPEQWLCTTPEGFLDTVYALAQFDGAPTVNALSVGKSY